MPPCSIFHVSNPQPLRKLLKNMAKSSLLSWLKPADAPAVDLEAQLAGARAALAAAQDAEADAQAKFLVSGTPDAEDAVVAARDKRLRAELQVKRAETLLDDAKARAAAEKRAEDDRRLAVVRDACSRDAVVAAGAELAQQEAEALAAVAAIRAKRMELKSHFEALDREHYSLLLSLGRVDLSKGRHRQTPPSYAYEATSAREVILRLDPVIEQHEHGSNMRNLLCVLRPDSGQYPIAAVRWDPAL